MTNALTNYYTKRVKQYGNIFIIILSFIRYYYCPPIPAIFLNALSLSHPECTLSFALAPFPCFPLLSPLLHIRLNFMSISSLSGTIFSILCNTYFYPASSSITISFTGMHTFLLFVSILTSAFIFCCESFYSSTLYKYGLPYDAFLNSSIGWCTNCSGTVVIVPSVLFSLESGVLNEVSGIISMRSSSGAIASLESSFSEEST